MQTKLVSSLVAAAIVLSLCAAARADARSDAEALQAYDEGTKFYTIGEFDKAIASYKRSWELHPDPVLLYNIAQAYRLSSDYPLALFFYRSYRRNLPNAANLPEVEKRMAELEDTIAKQKAAVSPPNEAVDPGGHVPRPIIIVRRPPPRPPTPGEVARLSAAGRALDRMDRPVPEAPRSRPVYRRWWFWAGVGVVAAGAAAAVLVAGAGSGAPSTHFGASGI